MTWARLGPLGGLRDIPNPTPETVVESSRAETTFPLLGGYVHVQRSPRRARAWRLGHIWQAPELLAYLTACAEGAIPGPLYLHTQDAALTNLLPSDVAAPCRMGTVALGSVSGVVAVGMGGGAVPSSGVVQQASAGAWSAIVPIRQVAHVLSGWASAAGAVVEWRTVTAAGVQVATGTVTAAAVTGGFYGAVSIVPGATVAGLQVRLAAGSRVVGGLRLVEGVLPDSGPVVATNLATNPSFEAASGTVEVRRNRALSPMPSATAWTAQWGTGGAGALTYSASGGPGGVGYKQMVWSAPGVDTPRMILTGVATAGIPVVAGETIPLSVDVASTAQVRITWDWYAGGTYLSSGSGAAITPSASISSPTRVSATTPPAPATATRINVFVSITPSAATGTTLAATRLLVGDAGEYFDGSTSPDSDLTASWTGTPNASVSVLTGASVAGITTSRCVAIRSTRWSKAGAYSMRIVPTGNPGDPVAYAYYTPAGGSRTGKTDTLLATVHLETPLLDGSGARMYLEGGVAPGNTANIANVAGDQDLRVTSARPGPYTASFFVLPSARGNGDVWVDCTATVEGVYTGPWFDGSNPPASRPDAIAAWTGTPNASPSVLKAIPEGAVQPGWAPGVGVPQVVVGDPQQTLQLVTDTEVLSDYTITLREVGR